MTVTGIIHTHITTILGSMIPGITIPGITVHITMVHTTIILLIITHTLTTTIRHTVLVMIEWITSGPTVV